MNDTRQLARMLRYLTFSLFPFLFSLGMTVAHAQEFRVG